MSRFVAALVFIVFSGAAGVGQQNPAPAPAAPAKQADAAQTAAAPRTPAQLVNIRLDLAISDQRGAGPAQSRLVTLLLGDRENGRVRSSQGNAMLNVDARPEIVREGRIRAFLALEYRPAADGDRPTTLLSESLSVLLDDGKPLLVSQSADPAADRAGVSVELKATIVK